MRAGPSGRVELKRAKAIRPVDAASTSAFRVIFGLPCLAVVSVTSRTGGLARFTWMWVVWGTKTMHHRAWDGFEARLAYTVAAFNILVKWNGLQPYDHGRTPLSITKFTL